MSVPNRQPPLLGPMICTKIITYLASIVRSSGVKPPLRRRSQGSGVARLGAQARGVAVSLPTARLPCRSPYTLMCIKG